MLAALAVAASLAASSTAPVRFGHLDVHVVHSRALHADRTIRVWVPPGFSRRARYDVLYLNDGQNLFGDGDPDSGGGGWRVDTTAARLVAAHDIAPLIVVGLDNGGDRARGIDYLPVPDPFSDDPATPGADRYLDFVIDEAMPFVEKHYPVRRGPEHTGFGGSSYGAVSAFYAALSRPGIFGRLLLESPSVGVGNGVLLDRARHTRAWPARIAVGIGTGERRGVETVQTLAAILRDDGLGDDRLHVVVQEGARHNEAAWASRLPEALEFLFRPPHVTSSHAEP
jgi:enterochelin esterase-like enzyme